MFSTETLIFPFDIVYYFILSVRTQSRDFLILDFAQQTDLLNIYSEKIIDNKNANTLKVTN